MKHLFVVAGETSGDRHAAALLHELFRLEPALRVTGLGGPQMAAAGAQLQEELTRHAVVGVVEVLKHYGTFRRIFREACRAFDRDRPDLVLLVDYPGFNLRLAVEAKRRGIPVAYYVSPQIWAWGRRRLHTIRRAVDQMLVLFAFEERLYREAGVPVEWVGHPLMDSVKVTQSRGETLRQYGLPEDRPILGILPGSRMDEVERLLPVLAGAAEQLAGPLHGGRFLVMQAPGIPTARYKALLESRRAALTLVPEWDHHLLATCDLVLVASGTATLECALLNRPMVIVYRTNPVTWWLGRRLVTLPYIGLVNVVAGRSLVPECLQNHATPSEISAAALEILRSEATRHAMEAGYREIRDSLGPPGASRRAAEAVMKLLQHR